MDGWQRLKVRVKWWMILVFFFWPIMPLMAEEKNEMTSSDMALIEFLGTWETKEGEWVDPLLFDDEAGKKKDIHLLEGEDKPQEKRSLRKGDRALKNEPVQEGGRNE